MTCTPPKIFPPLPVKKMKIRLCSQDLCSTFFHNRTFNGGEIPKTFVSKIPKPVSRRVIQTPDVTSVKRRSLTTTKKPRQTTGNSVRMDEVNRKKEFASPRMTGLKDKSQRRVLSEEKLRVSLLL